MSKQRTLAVIPARLASTRLPRKVLRELCGRPLLAWVYEAATRCAALDEVVIAGDSDEVAALCARERWPHVATDPRLASGSDRVHAVSLVREAEIYVNIQGDEPLLEPAHIEALLAPFALPEVSVTTLRTACEAEDIANPNVVKVVCGVDGRALYFSRSPIPFDRDGTGVPVWKHLGLYAYRAEALRGFHALAPTPLEQTERLEQLRLLEHGIALHVGTTSVDTVGVDTEADLVRVQEILRARKGL